MRNPGLVVKCGWNGKVPSNVSSAAIPPTGPTLLIREVGVQDLLEAQCKEELNGNITVIDPCRHLVSQDGEAVLHGVDVNTQLARDQLEVAALDEVALQGGKGPRFLEPRRSFGKHAVGPPTRGKGLSQGDAILAERGEIMDPPRVAEERSADTQGVVCLRIAQRGGLRSGRVAAQADAGHNSFGRHKILEKLRGHLSPLSRASPKHGDHRLASDRP